MEAPATQHDRQEGGREREHGGQQRATQSGRGPADERDRMRNGPRRELPEGDRVQELGLRHPAVTLDGVGLHQRNDHEAAAIGERADLDRRPGQPGQRCRGGDQHRPRVQRGVRAPAPRQLQQPRAQQHDDHVRSGEHRRRQACGHVGRGAQVVPSGQRRAAERMPAPTTTATTAAPAPAPIARIKRGGSSPSASAAIASTISRPGTIKPRPPISAPRNPPTRCAQ
jgi:hypothetical protein